MDAAIQSDIVFLDKSQTKNMPREQVLKIPIWNALDLKASQLTNSRLDEFIEQYNDNCPRKLVTDSLGRVRTTCKGRIKAQHRVLLNKLMYFAMRQMEDLRKSPSGLNRDMYVNRLSGDAIPVMTNRSALSAALKKEVCPNSVYNHIQLLLEAGIVTSKQNTSKKRKETIDGQIFYESMNNGRGDFQLWIKKEVFVPRFELVERAPQAPDDAAPGPGSAKKMKNGNTGSQHHQSQNLGQEYKPLSDTNKSIDNNSGKLHCDENGVPSEQNSLISPTSSDVELNSLKREGSIHDFLRRAAEIGGGKREKNAPVGQPISEGEKQKLKAKELARKQRLSIQVGRMLPSKEQDFYLELLVCQLISMLYPDINRNYLHRIRKDIKQLMGLHFKMLGLEPKKAYSVLSRAIHRAHVYSQKTGFKFYAPITYLRMDNDFEKGTFEYVVKWIKKEDFTLGLKAEKRSHLIKWQYAHVYSEDLYEVVVNTLKTGFFAANQVFKSGLKKLDAYMGKIKCSEKTKTRVRQEYISKCVNIFRELAVTSEESWQADSTWKAFEQWQKEKK